MKTYDLVELSNADMARFDSKISFRHSGSAVCLGSMDLGLDEASYETMHVMLLENGMLCFLAVGLSCPCVSCQTNMANCRVVSSI